MNFANFLKSNLVFFSNFPTFIVTIQVSFPAPGGKKPHLVFANSLLRIFFGHGMVFNILISFPIF